MQRGHHARPQVASPPIRCRFPPAGTSQAVSAILEGEGRWPQLATAAWQHGLVSNFQYLLYLNLLAGRQAKASPTSRLRACTRAGPPSQDL